MWNILQGYLEFQLWCFQLNFVCLDNLTVTLLCLLASLSCHCHLAPCPFYSLGLLNIRALFSDWIFISKHKHNHSPYRYILVLTCSLRKSNPRVSTLNIILCSFTSELSTCYFLLKMFFMPHEICTCEVKGTRQWRLFYGELSCVDVLVNITIVAVKCLIKRSNHDKLTVNCQ